MSDAGTGGRAGAPQAAGGWAPVPQVVARRLQAMILSGEWAPGDPIPSQRALSQSLAVSRASLREALMTLETLGLVRTEPGRGTFVAARASAAPSDPPSAAAPARWRYSGSHGLRDVFETRLMLEGRIAAAAAPAIDGAALALLAQATDEMERCWAAGDLLANVEADLLFHRTLSRACPNRLLVALYDEVAALLTETQRQPIPRTEPARMAASVGEHRALIAALAAGDPTACRLAMEAHVRNTAACAGVAI